MNCLFWSPIEKVECVQILCPSALTVSISRITVFSLFILRKHCIITIYRIFIIWRSVNPAEKPNWCEPIPYHKRVRCIIVWTPPDYLLIMSNFSLCPMWCVVCLWWVSNRSSIFFETSNFWPVVFSDSSTMPWPEKLVLSFTVIVDRKPFE